MSAGADIKANAFGAGGALERGHSAPLEPLAQLGDALRGVCAVAILVEAAQRVVSQAVSIIKEQCQRALTQKQTLGSWFEPGAAYLSDCSVELPLSPSASAMAPWSPILLW